jgi:hypothetical protein
MLLKIATIIRSLLLLSLATSVEAATLLDYNVPAGTTLFTGPLVATTMASSFTVGSQDIQITSLSFRLAGDPVMPYDTTAYIFASNTDRPGQLLASSHRAFSPGFFTAGENFNFYAYDLTNPLSLSAGITYWVGFGKADSGYALSVCETTHLSEFAATAVNPSLSFATATPLSYPPGNNWTPNASTSTLVYKIEGTIVPEPAAAALGILGMAALAFRNRLMKAAGNHRQPESRI